MAEERDYAPKTIKARLSAISLVTSGLSMEALIERDIRDRMRERGLQQLSLYPEDRACAAPTTRRILDIFRDLTRHHIQDPHGTTLKTFHPQPNELQTQILDLLEIPTTTYNPTT